MINERIESSLPAGEGTWRDYLALVRPRIMALVLFAMTVAAWTASARPPIASAVAHALAGTGLLIAGAVALNQRLESAADARMPRTAARPLPAGRLDPRQVTRFGLVASAAGMIYLAAFATLLLATLGLVSWLVYVWAYTPLKSRSVWQTPIGAVAGAMPVLLGAAAAAAPASPIALTLFGIVFFWQLPHSMAIAWLYRREFAAAEVKLATVVEPSGRTGGLLAVLGAAALVPVSLGPAALGRAEWCYVACVLALDAAYLGGAAAFLLRRDDAAARRLLRLSLVYLPVLLAAVLLTRFW